MNDALQDDEFVKFLIRDQTRMEGMRAPMESLFQELEQRVDPESGGGFTPSQPGSRRSGRNFDVTAGESLDRFKAAMAAITLPRQTQYIKLKFGDPNLDRLPSVRRWCEYGGDRLYAIRYAPHARFQTEAFKDFRQLGLYGTGPLWTGERKGVGLFYKALHLSECFIDEDFAGTVDVVHRKFTLDVRQCVQMFTEDGLTPKMAKAKADGKLSTEFQIIHAVRPNGECAPDRMDWRGKPIGSTYVALDEKMIVKRGGFHTMPISVSRHMTGAADIYGRSPAMRVLPSILTANVMGQTNLRAGHKLTDPALLFYDDDGITSLVTRPGGANPGLMNEQGRPLVGAMPGPQNLPIGLEMQEAERKIIRSAFLEDFFKVLLDDKVQRSAQAILEMTAQQGILVAPYADQYESEKQNPVTQRDLDLAMRAGQIDPFPPEVIEAGAYPLIEYENPLSRMARAGEVAALGQWFQIMAPAAQIDPSVYDRIDADATGLGVAEALNLRPSWLSDDDAVAAKRKAREDSKAAAAGVEQLGTVAGAAADFAKANQLSEAA